MSVRSLTHLLPLRLPSTLYTEWDWSQHPPLNRGHIFKRWTLTFTYSRLADGRGGYLRRELITPKSIIQRAEQMTFTGGQPRCLITHFHKVAELVCQTGARYKQRRNNNTSNLSEESNKTERGAGVLRGDISCSQNPITKCSVRGAGALRVLGAFFEGDELTG